MSNPTSEINTKIAIGASWMIALRWADRFVGLFSIAILARLLLPEDFGLVAYALIVLGILDQFLEFNFATVLIRDNEATDDKYNTVWTLELIKGFTLASVMIITAVPVSEFFNEPQIQEILYWLALTPMLKALTNIGTVNFQKHLLFDKDFIMNLSVRIVGSTTTIVLAFVLRSYWALVYGSVINAALLVVMSYVMSDYRPRLCLSEWSRVLGFSKWLLVQNIFSSANARLPALVIGRFFEAQTLAIYNIARELTEMVKSEIGAPIRRALFPGIAKMQDDPAQIRNALTMALGIIALIGLPAIVGMAITAPLFIPLFLGSNWNEAIPVVQILAINAAIYMYYPNSHVVYYALNKPEITARISILRIVMFLPAVLVFAPDHGVFGVAWCLTAVTALIMVLEYVVMFRLKMFTFSNLLSSVWRSTVAVIFMAICVTYFLERPPFQILEESRTIHLLLCVAAGAASYSIAIGSLWWVSGRPAGAEAYASRTLKKMYNKLRPARA